MFAKSEEKTSHRFGIVVLKTGLSVSRPIENSGVEWSNLSRFQNLVCFFSLSLFFVLTCCKIGALDFVILLRFHSNRIIQTRIFLYVCKTPAAVAAAAAPAEPAAATPPPQRPPPPRPSPPWSPPPRPPPPRKRAAVAATPLHTQNSNQHILYGCRKFKMIFKFGFFGLSALE